MAAGASSRAASIIKTKASIRVRIANYSPFLSLTSNLWHHRTKVLSSPSLEGRTFKPV